MNSKGLYSILLILLTSCLIALSGCSAVPVKFKQEKAKTAVLLMHGKGGDTRWVEPMAEQLEAAGINVLMPDMPWHNKRIYDKTFENSMKEIHAYVTKLRSDGAREVYVAGHSLGAIAAAGYAARYDDVNGLILLAPGHFTAWPGFHQRFVADLQKAEFMIKTGEGEKRGHFVDLNEGKEFDLSVTANIYISWFAENGPAEFVTNMQNIRGNIPVLYVAGDQDIIPQTKNRAYAFEKIPSNSRSRFIVVESTHRDVPRVATPQIIKWIVD